MKNNCDFCGELSDEKDGTFNKIYSNIIKSRIIYQDDTFVVVPTIGQLFKNSLLVFPREHIELLSELNLTERIHLNNLFQRIKKSLLNLGSIVAFEHGAKCYTNGGCGIYHAHLHIVPLPEETSLFDFFKHEYTRCTDIVNGLEEMSNVPEYLMAINPDNKCAILDITNFAKDYPSQFFRRELMNHFKLEKSWNWKDYCFPEEWLLSTLDESLLQA
jgi:diadenosine tetraphosphate (Ap4A) HIT family hydrolase